MFGGKCPNCSTVIHSVEVEFVKGKTNDVESCDCFLHKCPVCNTIISVQVNPIQIQQNIIYLLGEQIKEIQPKKRKIPLNLNPH